MIDPNSKSLSFHQQDIEDPKTKKIEETEPKILTGIEDRPPEEEDESSKTKFQKLPTIDLSTDTDLSPDLQVIKKKLSDGEAIPTTKVISEMLKCAGTKYNAGKEKNKEIPFDPDQQNIVGFVAKPKEENGKIAFKVSDKGNYYTEVEYEVTIRFRDKHTGKDVEQTVKFKQNIYSGVKKPNIQGLSSREIWETQYAAFAKIAAYNQFIGQTLKSRLKDKINDLCQKNVLNVQLQRNSQTHAFGWYGKQYLGFPTVNKTNHVARDVFDSRQPFSTFRNLGTSPDTKGGGSIAGAFVEGEMIQPTHENRTNGKYVTQFNVWNVKSDVSLINQTWNLKFTVEDKEIQERKQQLKHIKQEFKKHLEESIKEPGERRSESLYKKREAQLNTLSNKKELKEYKELIAKQKELQKTHEGQSEKVKILKEILDKKEIDKTAAKKELQELIDNSTEDVKPTTIPKLEALNKEIEKLTATIKKESEALKTTEDALKEITEKIKSVPNKSLPIEFSLFTTPGPLSLKDLAIVLAKDVQDKLAIADVHLPDLSIFTNPLDFVPGSPNRENLKAPTKFEERVLSVENTLQSITQIVAAEKEVLKAIEKLKNKELKTDAPKAVKEKQAKKLQELQKQYIELQGMRQKKFEGVERAYDKFVQQRELLHSLLIAHKDNPELQEALKEFPIEKLMNKVEGRNENYAKRFKEFNNAYEKVTTELEHLRKTAGMPTTKVGPQDNKVK